MQIYGIDLSMEKFDVNYIDKNGKEKKKRREKQVERHLEFFSNGSSQSNTMCRKHWDLQRHVGFSQQSKRDKYSLSPGLHHKAQFGDDKR